MLLFILLSFFFQVEDSEEEVEESLSESERDIDFAMNNNNNNDVNNNNNKNEEFVLMQGESLEHLDWYQEALKVTVTTKCYFKWIQLQPTAQPLYNGQSDEDFALALQMIEDEMYAQELIGNALPKTLN